MRSVCAIGLSLAFLFAGTLARAQQVSSAAKLAPGTPAANKTTCEKSVAKIGAAAPTVARIDLFVRLDVNKDGKISPAEYKGPKQAFAWVDTDHDGYITRPEATRAYLTIVGRMAIDQRIKAFKEMDENKDGKVSLAEYKGPTRAFARIDVNHDGVITPEEARHAFVASVDRFVVATRFQALDANHDGKISATEFKGPKAVFDRYSDKNGLIGPAAYARLVHQRRAAWVQLAVRNPAANTPKPVAAVTKTQASVVKTVKAGPAQKAVPPATHKSGLDRIMAMDVNKDGKIGMGEYFQAVEARFAFLDQDKDGYITAQDLVKVAALRKAKATGAPVAATPAAKPITRATVKPPAKPAPAKPAVTPGTGTPAKKVAATVPARASRLEAAFDEIDANHDGVLTRAEIRTYASKRPHANPTVTAHHHG